MWRGNSGILVIKQVIPSRPRNRGTAPFARYAERHRRAWHCRVILIILFIVSAAPPTHNPNHCTSNLLTACHHISLDSTSCFEPLQTRSTRLSVYLPPYIAVSNVPYSKGNG